MRSTGQAMPAFAQGLQHRGAEAAGADMVLKGDDETCRSGRLFEHSGIEGLDEAGVDDPGVGAVIA